MFQEEQKELLGWSTRNQASPITPGLSLRQERLREQRTQIESRLVGGQSVIEKVTVWNRNPDLALPVECNGAISNSHDPEAVNYCPNHHHQSVFVFPWSDPELIKSIYPNFDPEKLTPDMLITAELELV